jgi:RHS repeat-associated protein
LLNRARYEAYGYVAQGTKPGPGTSVIGFTGHVQDKETDLVYMQQRYYDPIAGRFLSVDPVTTDAATGKSFGRYHYAANNPYTKVDRDGRDAEHAYIPGGMTRGEYQAANVQAAEHTAVVGVHVAQMVPQLRVAATAIKGVMSLARSTTQPGAAKGDKLPDNALVCRGGTCTADKFANGSGVTIDGSGKMDGVSVNSGAGKSLGELTAGIPNKQVGVTTVGDVRAAGGDVIPSPTPNNPNHCTLCGITPQKAEELMTPTVRNPNAK